jgi:hypothetical protein
MINFQKTAAILLLITLLTLGILQFMALSSLPKDTKYDTVRAQLTWGGISSLAVFVLVFTVYYFSITQTTADDQSTFDGIVMFFTTVGIALNAGNSANAAITLQCSKDDPNVGNAWNYSMISSIVGFSAVFLVLTIKLVSLRQTIKEKICGGGSKEFSLEQLDELTRQMEAKEAATKKQLRTIEGYKGAQKFAKNE